MEADTTDYFQILFDKSLLHILEWIFLSLEPHDLLKCQSVCLQWRHFLMHYPMKQKVRDKLFAHYWLKQDLKLRYCVHNSDLRYSYDILEYWTTDGHELFLIAKESSAAAAAGPNFLDHQVDVLEPLTYLLVYSDERLRGSCLVAQPSHLHRLYFISLTERLIVLHQRCRRAIHLVDRATCKYVNVAESPCNKENEVLHRVVNGALHSVVQADNAKDIYKLDDERLVYEYIGSCNDCHPGCRAEERHYQMDDYHFMESCSHGYTATFSLGIGCEEKSCSNEKFVAVLVKCYRAHTTWSDFVLTLYHAQTGEIAREFRTPDSYPLHESHSGIETVRLTLSSKYLIWSYPCLNGPDGEISTRVYVFPLAKASVRYETSKCLESFEVSEFGYVDSLNVLRERVLLITYQEPSILSYRGGVLAIDLHAPASNSRRRHFPDLTLSGRMTDVSNKGLEVLPSKAGFVYQSSKDDQLVLVGEDVLAGDDDECDWLLQVGKPRARRRLSLATGDGELFWSEKERLVPMCGLM